MRFRLTPPRLLPCIALAMAFAMLAGCCDEKEEGTLLLVNNANITAEGLPEGTNRMFGSGQIHFLVIRDHPDDASKIRITNASGSDDDIKVLAGDLILWSNQSAQDRTIEFDDGADPLFGVGLIKIHKGRWVTLRVRLSATPNRYIYKSDHKDDAPPAIIVCPPPGC
jgi:hypothetical protein